MKRQQLNCDNTNVSYDEKVFSSKERERVRFSPDKKYLSFSAKNGLTRLFHLESIQR